MDTDSAKELLKLTPFQRLKAFFTYRYYWIVSIFAFFAFLIGFAASLDQQLSLTMSRQYQAQERLARADIMIIKVETTLRDNQKIIFELGKFIAQVRDATQVDSAQSNPELYKSSKEQLNNLIKLHDSYRQLEEYLQFYREILMMREYSFNPFISQAHAAEQGHKDASRQSMTIENLKPALLVVVFGGITLLFILSGLVFCFAQDTDKIKAADNTMRTILGFYIGVATGLLGLPTPA